MRRALSFVAALALTGCYAARGGPNQDFTPRSGIWHLQYQGSGEESRDYRIVFQATGDLVVYDGDVRHDADGHEVTSNFTTLNGGSSSLFEHPMGWNHRTAVLHTFYQFSGRGSLAAREYTFRLQDEKTMVGQVTATTRVDGIYTRRTFPARGTFVRDR